MARKRVISIGYLPTLSTVIHAAIESMFRRGDAVFQIDSIPMFSREGLEKLKAKEIHLLITWGPFDRKFFIGSSLERLELKAVMAASDWLAEFSKVTMRDFFAHSVVLPSCALVPDQAQKVVSICHAHGYKLRDAGEAECPEAMMAHISYGDVGILPTTSAYLAPKNVVFRSFEIPQYEKLFLIRRDENDKFVDNAAKKFLPHIHRAIKKHKK